MLKSQESPEQEEEPREGGHLAGHFIDGDRDWRRLEETGGTLSPTPHVAAELGPAGSSGTC